MAKALKGQCFCGAVKYELTAKPMFVNCCHCKDCRRQTSSAFAINAVIEAKHVKLVKGKPVAISMKTDSGYPHDIYRCPQCQSALWSDYGRRKVLLFVRSATLDKPISPDAHIFTRSKLPWVILPKDVPVFKVYYDMKKVWPAASLKRRVALKAG
jgi:hypothetical protein